MCLDTPPIGSCESFLDLQLLYKRIAFSLLENPYHTKHVAKDDYKWEY